MIQDGADIQAIYHSDLTNTHSDNPRAVPKYELRSKLQ